MERAGTTAYFRYYSAKRTPISSCDSAESSSSFTASSCADDKVGETRTSNKYNIHRTQSTHTDRHAKLLLSDKHCKPVRSTVQMTTPPPPPPLKHNAQPTTRTDRCDWVMGSHMTVGCRKAAASGCTMLSVEECVVPVNPNLHNPWKNSAARTDQRPKLLLLRCQRE